MNADLRYWYWFYNRKYFKGRLPKARVKFKRIEPRDLGECLLEDKTIHIAKELKRWPCIAKSTLLHEMVHLSLSHSNQEHGRKFQKEMLRLAKKGAFKGLW